MLKGDSNNPHSNIQSANVALVKSKDRLAV